MSPTIEISPEEMKSFMEKVKDTNINQVSLLATDYLNHFNEIAMLIEMVADMPDMLEECKSWRPKTYKAHFEQSNFADKDIYVEAYDYVQAKYKKPFEDLIRQLNFFVVQSMEKIEISIEKGDAPEVIHHLATGSARAIYGFIELTSSIIHGSDKTLDQSQVDDLMGF